MRPKTPQSVLAVLLSAALLAPSGGLAARQDGALQHNGEAPARIAGSPNYGVSVAARTALRELVPAGWKTYVHHSATLPATLSWSRGAPWTKVLEDMALGARLAVMVDWQTQTVLIRTPEVAAEELQTRQSIARAATTPLPRFEGQDANLSRNEQHRFDEWQAARHEQSQALAQLPVIRSNPTPMMVEAQSKAAEKKPAMRSTEDFTYSGPSAWNKPSSRQLAQGIANKFGLRLVWAAPAEQLRGPVTLLGASAKQDVHLLNRALGPFAAVELELIEQDKVLRAVPRGGVPGEWLSDAAADWPGTQVAAGADSTPGSAVALGPLGDAAVSGPAAPLLSMTIAEGASLEDALIVFARDQGFTLEWKVDGGFEAGRTLSYSGNTLVQVLAQALPPLGISADVYTRDKHIVIRPGEARDR